MRPPQRLPECQQPDNTADADTSDTSVVIKQLLVQQQLFVQQLLFEQQFVAEFIVQ